MKKSTLWKDIRKAFRHSKGRFFSIICLIALGSFALVGLKVTGPDMRRTGQDYFDQHQLADIIVMSQYGLNQDDKDLIEQAAGINQVEFGYQQDVVIKRTNQSLRIFSKTPSLSQYRLVEGILPSKKNEIALYSDMMDQYPLDSWIDVKELPNSLDHYNLENHKFKVVGFVDSTEILSTVSLGPSQSGSGELKAYGVVAPITFDSPVYMNARLSFDNLVGVNPYSQTYIKRLHKHKEELEELFDHRSAERYQELRDDTQEAISEGKQDIADSRQKIKNKETELKDAKDQLDQGRRQLDESKATLDQLKAQAEANPEALQAVYDEKKTSYDLAEAEWQDNAKEYEDKHHKFEEKKADAEETIKTAEKDIAKAEEFITNLTESKYSILTRRETPGAKGYKIYTNIEEIVEDLANIFPIFLYFVAALVTFNTMTRFVDEERMNAGILKAIGYTDRDVSKKFVVYGLVASLLGATIGIALGHTLLPIIVYSAYKDAYKIQPLELRFYWDVTLIAISLALISAVLPALKVVRQELKESPAQLLLPKPPVQGEKILLERIPFIWKRLSFTKKVTARNIFRYKKRMFMTIFGVSGGVALLFAGLAVQHSISGISNRQFQEIIQYDMIVAQKDHLTDEEYHKLSEKLDQDDIAHHLAIHFDKLSKVAGKKADEQEINLIVPEKSLAFSQYLKLSHRQNQETLKLSSDGAIISEKLAELLNLKPGDSFEIEDSQGKNHTIKVADVTEMYIAHFVFMNSEYYEKSFAQNYETNGQLIQLKDKSKENVEEVATQFMNLKGVEGVIQNISHINQIATVVDSLNMIMEVLIVVAIFLTIVILYNLTNINVSERLRELSTIKVLGFHNKEVTMYIYRETIIQSLVGILLGYLLGNLLHRYIITTVAPEDVMFNLIVGPMAYLLPLAIVVIIFTVLGFMVNRRLRRVDMLEALKSVE
ncbi:ABC transporter permease [Ignavigranum ruoffiae]|uniref:ABC transporter permease n=1 Tax=Ignavigranum ruoffiae TaxID=89093 RepID=UPI0024ACC3C4|nr:FtsX-like permease family protein [Ignavigranum ruoffiae]